MKIYTKTGDLGETGLYGGPRVWKDHPRLAAYGDVDELNCVLGMVRSEELAPEMDHLLEKIQHNLFAAGAELASPDPKASATEYLSDQDVHDLETAIDKHEATLQPLKQFILPAGSSSAASLHFARAVCRRMERNLITLRQHADQEIRRELLQYVNRLSDLLFVLARSANAAVNQTDIPWKKPASEDAGS